MNMQRSARVAHLVGAQAKVGGGGHVEGGDFLTTSGPSWNLGKVPPFGTVTFMWFNIWTSQVGDVNFLGCLNHTSFYG